MTAVSTQDEPDSRLRPIVSNQERPQEAPEVLSIPKNRSTGDLLGSKQHDGRLRVSFDAGSGHPAALRSPISAEHDQGLGISGLRRIRQQPLSRAPTTPSSPTNSHNLPPRSSSMTLNVSSRNFTPNGPTSPTMNFGEDLSRFPSESLHSFSFAHQSEDVLHNRQSVLKRAIEFMRDRLGLGSSHPGIIAAQAKVSGDSDIQSMVDLLVRADVLGKETSDISNSKQLRGPLTGPADVDGNVFENAFWPNPQPSNQSSIPLPSSQAHQQREGNERSQSGSRYFEPSLNSENSAPNLHEPTSPLSTSPLSQSPQPQRELSKKKRTYTDLSLLTLQTKLVEAMAQPYHTSDHIHDTLLLSPTPRTVETGVNTPSHVHGHNNRWRSAAQAIFTTEAASPWTILAANDLACLVFGVTKAEVKKLSMLEVVREDRRPWLEEKLQSEGSEAILKHRQPRSKSARTSPKSSTSLSMRGGVTAKLLSKPSWRLQRAQTDNLKANSTPKDPSKHMAHQSRGVLLCGDIVPIQKRNGTTGAASLWVKEKRNGLIWVLEEIAEDIAILSLDARFEVTGCIGAIETIWGIPEILAGTIIQDLVPCFPTSENSLALDTVFKRKKIQYFAATAADGVNIPVSVSLESSTNTLRVSSLPHIAGIIVISASDLVVLSSNSVFCASLFGQPDPNQQKIDRLIPQFDKFLEILTQEDGIDLVDGLVVPEQSFRKARAVQAFREGKSDATAIFLQSQSLIARHRDGSEFSVDVQMRVVRSEQAPIIDPVIEEQSEDGEVLIDDDVKRSELVYALWITYSRQLHSMPPHSATSIPPAPSIPHLPSPGQLDGSASPLLKEENLYPSPPPMISLSEQIKEAASVPISQSPPDQAKIEPATSVTTGKVKHRPKNDKKITDFVILEDMGQGAYGQVKLARCAQPSGKKVVLKYVTKKRILVDTWTRDRRLGTVPLEIHVLDYLRKDELRHPNIVEMTDFFEDDVNYYIEMVPHGLPGMDLFDYIEMRSTMGEAECRNIFLQVVDALHHLHTKALVVHRDIKDENIILDGEGKVKLIDFGSAAYIKNGPFDVFVGTIDYAAPEVLQGKSYRGKEQDIWALGILLYTLVYKENPFYSIDEILDHELRIPWIMSEPSIALIQAMLNRNVDERLDIEQVKEHEWCRGDED